MREKIVVGALDRTLEFKNLRALSAHVDQILDRRGRDLAPMDVAAIQRLDAERDGPADDEVARIARSTAVHTPSPPDRPATPLDEAIQEAAERRAEAEEAEREALEHRTAVRTAARAEYEAAEREAAKSGRGGGQLRTLKEKLWARVRAAGGEYLSARERALRARAEHHRLQVERDRFLAVEEHHQTMQ